MQDSKELIYSSNEALAVIIEATKKYQKEYDLTPIEAFRQTLLILWKYSQSWCEMEYKSFKFYSFERYKDLFYHYIIGIYIGIPVVIREYITSYYSESGYSKTLDMSTLNELKTSMKDIADKEASRLEQLNKIREETEELRRILGYQDSHKKADALVSLYMIFKEDNKDTFRMIIDAFNYGYMQGKHDVRSRMN